MSSSVVWRAKAKATGNKAASKMRENVLYEQLAQYLNMQYPHAVYHFDLSGLWTPSHSARNLYGRLNSRAWPDLFIAYPNAGWGIPCHGLFIELKREGNSPFLKDGVTLKKDTHVHEQAAMLEELRNRGYAAEFACGFDEAKQLIDDYFSVGAPKPANQSKHEF